MIRKIVLLLIVVLAAAAFALSRSEQYNVTIPAASPRLETVLLDQGWSVEQRTQFHHTAQGTRLLPYEWFMALEQPCWSLLGCEPFSDSAYLARFGFVEGAKDDRLNPGGLPVGFARQADFRDPGTNETYAVVGLTCAACHTGELIYGNKAFRIEGGASRADLAQFQKALGLAMGFTGLIPFRYARFEAKVLPKGAGAEEKAALKKKFDELLSAMKAEKKLVDDRHIYDNLAGFGRTDALTRIGNQAFAIDMRIPDNLTPANAPVRFPQVWDAPWFNWVQYNSSIADPLVRNIGEAVGVRALVKLYGDDAREFKNSIHMEGLKTLEDLIAGPAPFEGLRSPKWPPMFPALAAAKVARGAELYKKNCRQCHLPPIEELRAELKTPDRKNWTKNEYGKPFVRMTDIPVPFVGTDPNQAMDFVNRTADSGALGMGRMSAAAGLETVTRSIAKGFFVKAALTREQQMEWSGYRDPGSVAVRAKPIYKARPLNGIWAVAPYLHNGSVPNLYLLLSPPADRPPVFWTGSKKFDPVKVGFEYAEFDGAYKFDISRPGNRNRGHEFRDGERGNGVVGPALSHDERMDLIEYLKSL